MRKIIQFPTRAEANPVRQAACRPLVCRWVCDAETGRLEQRWSSAAPAAKALPASDPSDAAA